ncbi:MAG TPA: hypothetical protein VM598_00310, partial [Bdellovibrionota bacterium]|nr:hypothetical protein [Bdellovibrionota bacterium]
MIIAVFGPGSAAGGDWSELIERQNPERPTIFIRTSERNSPDGYALLSMPLADLEARLELTRTGVLENAFFKVVENKGTEALPVSDFDGRNVLYHLMQSRAYFKSLADRTGVAAPQLDQKITVRVRVTWEPNPILIFSQKPKFNDSGYRPFRTGREIWMQARDSHFKRFDLYSYLTGAGFAIISGTWWSLGLDTVTQAYRNYDAGLDGAKIPTVVWHEAFHWAADSAALYPVVWSHQPTGEDLANYFASSQGDRPAVAELGEFASRFYRRDYRKLRPIKNFRASAYNSMAFVPSLLWEFRRWLGKERADALVWRAIPLLQGSVLESDLAAALAASARADTSLSVAEKAKVVAALEKNLRSFHILDQVFGNASLEETPAPGGGADPAALVAELSEEEIKRAALEQADELATIPVELKELGLPLSASEEATLRTEIDQLKRDAGKPGFKSRVLGSLRAIGHAVATAGIYAGQGVGYASEAARAAMGAPLAAGT